MSLEQGIWLDPLEIFTDQVFFNNFKDMNYCQIEMNYFLRKKGKNPSLYI